eukprot:PLAT15236.1.p1 GENE.PLAT15236.1~~PLAT15236.1.p1  ORF type:complete len:500 (+),score=163.21 PLAT15236.1:40-1539(+)
MLSLTVYNRFRKAMADTPAGGRSRPGEQLSPALSTFGTGQLSWMSSSISSGFALAPRGSKERPTSPGPVYKPTTPTGYRPMSSMFGRGERKTELTTEHSPGPIYLVRPTFSGRATFFGLPPVRRADEEDDKPAVFEPPDGLSGFGFGCSVEEHIRYGACLDGRCSQRGSWERSQQLRSLADRRSRRDVFEDAILDEAPPTHFVCAAKDAPKLAHLLRIGADPLARDVQQRTALHAAAAAGFAAGVRQLLAAVPQSPAERAAALDAADVNGATALHLAAACGSSEVVALLCEEGCSLTALDKRGRSALACAQLPRVASLIRRYQLVASQAAELAARREALQARAVRLHMPWRSMTAGDARRLLQTAAPPYAAAHALHKLPADTAAAVMRMATAPALGKRATTALLRKADREEEKKKRRKKKKKKREKKGEKRRKKTVPSGVKKSSRKGKRVLRATASASSILLTSSTAEDMRKRLLRSQRVPPPSPLLSATTPVRPKTGW